jgi:hypothetical protein
MQKSSNSSNQKNRLGRKGTIMVKPLQSQRLVLVLLLPFADAPDTLISAFLEINAGIHTSTAYQCIMYITLLGCIR